MCKNRNKTVSRTQSSNDGVSLNKEPLKALGVVSKIEY